MKREIMYLSQKLKTREGIKMSLLEVSLRWLRYHSKLLDDDAIILGFSKLEHCDANLDIMKKGPLPDDILILLDKAWDTISTKCPKYHR